MRTVDRLVAGMLPYVPRTLVGRVARRYIAGDAADAALRVVGELNRQGFRATMDILGESVNTLERAQTAAQHYFDLLDALQARGMNSTVSVKLTQLGLKVDPKECRKLAESVVVRAGEHSNFVRFDMEDSSCTTATLETYAWLRQHHDNVGAVVQAYLRRTVSDVERLLELRPNFRLCKGVYVEPEAIAYRDMAEINTNYLRLLDLLFKHGVYVGIATHDEFLVREAQRRIAEYSIPPTAYEFQMLLGVNERLRDRIRDAGHPLRVYVPFGPDWYAYSVRRLRENPRLAGQVLRAMFR